MPPHFQSSTLAVAESSFVETFPFVARRQRRCDVLVFERPAQAGGGTSTSVALCLLRNPCSDSKKLAQDWDRIKVTTLRKPKRSIAFADISKNGFNDVIVVEEMEASTTFMRISWLENVGDYATGWKRREIGRCRSIRSIKVGHFTNTFSLQILVTQEATKESGPLIMFTQPLNVTGIRQPWPSSFVSAELRGTITDICVIRPDSTNGELDKVLIMSEASMSLVWWENGIWNTHTLATYPDPRSNSMMCVDSRNMMCVGSAKESGIPEFIACVQPVFPSKISVYTPSHSVRSLRRMEELRWDHRVLDDFSPSIIVNVQSIEIGELVGFVVLLALNDPSHSQHMLYFYYPVGHRFDKMLIAEGEILSGTVGAIRSPRKSDIITSKMTGSGSINRQSELTVHSMFTEPLIQPSIDPSRSNRLVLTVVEPSTVGPNKQKLTLFSTSSKTFSLVLLGPNQTYKLPSFSTIKVLRGTVESKQQSYRTVRRSYLTFRDVLTQSLDVDSCSMTAGSRGAICILLVEDENSVPGLHINAFTQSLLKWEQVPDRKEFCGVKVYTLDAFRLKILGGMDIAHVHFTSFQDRGLLDGLTAPPTSIFAPDSSNPLKNSRSSAICQVRCSIWNTLSKAGIYHSNGPGVVTQVFSPRKVGSVQQQQRPNENLSDVWMDVDFTPWAFDDEDLRTSSDGVDRLDKRVLVTIIVFCALFGVFCGYLIRRYLFLTKRVVEGLLVNSRR